MRAARWIRKHTTELACRTHGAPGATVPDRPADLPAAECERRPADRHASKYAPIEAPRGGHTQSNPATTWAWPQSVGCGLGSRTNSRFLLKNTAQTRSQGPPLSGAKLCREVDIMQQPEAGDLKKRRIIDDEDEEQTAASSAASSKAQNVLSKMPALSVQEQFSPELLRM